MIKDFIYIERGNMTLLVVCSEAAQEWAEINLANFEDVEGGQFWMKWLDAADHIYDMRGDGLNVFEVKL